MNEKKTAWKVRLDKSRSTWNWFTTNPQGGGFGSNHCGARRVALCYAVRNIPFGETYEITINGKTETAVRGREPAKFGL
jgi:hypothetical protein